MVKGVIGFLTGLLFGVGLMISQMVNPNKVLNFLDIAGNWDPSLMFVMGGALVVFAGGYFGFIKHRQTAYFGSKIPTVSTLPVDNKLITGAALFGIGWGISGICPGPAIANIGALNISMLAFIAVMIAGLFIGNAIKSKI